MKRIAAIIVAMALTACSPNPATDIVERNKRIVLGMTEAINARDLAALDTYLSPQILRHSSSTPGLVVENRDQFKAFLESDFEAVPDSLQTVNLILGEDDMVAVHVTYAGTQTGAFGPFPSSGNRMEIPFIGILRIEDGLIAEIWVEWDNLNALTQLGHFPPPASEPGQQVADPDEV
jgi:steroid delta-isomerase-like uncharacterized protein